MTSSKSPKRLNYLQLKSISEILNLSKVMKLIDEGKIFGTDIYMI